MKVVIRCRPLNSLEKGRSEHTIVQMDPTDGRIELHAEQQGNDEPPKVYTFDNVFPPGTSQVEIFDVTAKPIVDNVLTGFNGTIFCYGQTGTGKTFTMEGVADNADLKGIMPRCFEYVFGAISKCAKNQEFLIRVSFLEIYNNEVYDLLNKDERRKMELKENKDKGVFVKDLTTFVVKSATDCQKILNVGQKQRSVGATAMNAGSSRSHCILSIIVENSETDADGTVHYRVGKLNLVDLAGSERQKRTGATGDRLMEAKSINLSLSALGNVIKALINPKAKHIPFRDSKLTRLLQDSLGGNTKTVMCANLGPANLSHDETLSTLRYANRAKSIKNKPKINEDPKDAMLREMQDEIAQLKKMLELRRKGMTAMEGDLHQAEIALDGSTEIRENLITKEVIVDTGISEEDLKSMEKKERAEYEELKKKQEEEAKKIRAKKEEAEEAARVFAEELKLKQNSLEKEKRALDKMEAMLSQKETQVLAGNEAIEKVMEQKRLLEKTEAELEARREHEETLKQGLMDAEEAELYINEQYNSTKEELEKKNQKLRALWNKYSEKKNEIEDIQDEFEIEREDLVDTIRELDRQMRLKHVLLDAFIPQAYVEMVEKQSVWDTFNESWQIPGLEFAYNNVRMEGDGGFRQRGDGMDYAHLAMQQDQYGVQFDPSAGADMQQMMQQAQEATADGPSTDQFLSYGQYTTTNSKKKSRRKGRGY